VWFFLHHKFEHLQRSNIHKGGVNRGLHIRVYIEREGQPIGDRVAKMRIHSMDGGN
jgi:hypothetical protein